MGLIDSTNRIERALLTAKQEKAQERAEKKQQQAIKARDKIDREIARDVVTEALEYEIIQIYEMLPYTQADLILKSLETRKNIIAKVSTNELEKRFADTNYEKIKSTIGKRYKFDNEYKKTQPIEETPEEEKQAKKARFNDVCKAIAQIIYNVIIGVFKIIGFFLLIVMGFTKFVFAVQPQQKRRYR